jgi:hypothetical protein
MYLLLFQYQDNSKLFHFKNQTKSIIYNYLWHPIINLLIYMQYLKKKLKFSFIFMFLESKNYQFYSIFENLKDFLADGF